MSLLCTSCALIISSWWMAMACAQFCKVTLGNDGGDVPTNLVILLYSRIATLVFSNPKCGTLKIKKDEVSETCSLFNTMQNRTTTIVFIRDSQAGAADFDAITVLVQQFGCMSMDIMISTGDSTVSKGHKQFLYHTAVHTAQRNETS